MKDFTKLDYSKPHTYPSDWKCGSKGHIMGGNSMVLWSPCSVMDFRQIYTQHYDDWCLRGKNIQGRR